MRKVQLFPVMALGMATLGVFATHTPTHAIAQRTAAHQSSFVAGGDDDDETDNTTAGGSGGGGGGGAPSGGVSAGGGGMAGSDSSNPAPWLLGAAGVALVGTGAAVKRRTASN